MPDDHDRRRICAGGRISDQADPRLRPEGPQHAEHGALVVTSPPPTPTTFPPTRSSAPRATACTRDRASPATAAPATVATTVPVPRSPSPPARAPGCSSRSTPRGGYRPARPRRRPRPVRPHPAGRRRAVVTDCGPRPQSGARASICRGMQRTTRPPRDQQPADRPWHPCPALPDLVHLPRRLPRLRRQHPAPVLPADGADRGRVRRRPDVPRPGRRHRLHAVDRPTISPGPAPGTRADLQVLNTTE